MHSNPAHICKSLVLLLAGVALVTLSSRAQTKETKGQTEESAATQLARSGEPFVRFTATTENIVDSQDAIRIDLMRWSTEAERNQLPTVWNQALARAAAIKSAHHSASAATDKTSAVSPKGRPPIQQATTLTPRASLYAALEKLPTVGYIWSSAEVSGYAIKYAVELPQPDGGERVILLTDRKLGDQDGRWNFVDAGAAKQPVVSTAGDYDSGSDGKPNQYDEYSIIELHVNSRGQGEGRISRDYTVTIDNTAKVLELPSYKDLPVVFKNVQRRKFSANGKES